MQSKRAVTIKVTDPSRSLLRSIIETVLLRRMRGPTKSLCFFLSLTVLATTPLGWAVDCTRCGETVTAGDSANAVPTPTAMQMGSFSSHPNSGIYGHMVAAWGNPPAQPPTYECVRVLDTTGHIVVAKGACSGLWGEFRVPLEPGQYIVEAGGRWETAHGAVRFVPHHRTVEIKAGEWVEIAPPTPPAPVP
jgi:hypothetical protein